MIAGFVYLQDMLPLFVFAGIVAGIWAVLSMISNRNSKALDRLARFNGKRGTPGVEIDDPKKSERMQGLLDTAKALSSPLMPQTELEQNKLKLKLANAGFRSDAAPMVYSGLRLACLLFGFIVSAAIFIPGQPLGWKTIQYVVIFTGIGFYLPNMVLWWIKRKRQQEIFLSLPDALDLLVVCVESGLGLDAAMRKVTDELGSHAKVISEEFTWRTSSCRWAGRAAKYCTTWGFAPAWMTCVRWPRS
jgi:tight adherence protein C